MTNRTGISTELYAASRNGAILGELLRDYVGVVGTSIVFKERDADGDVIELTIDLGSAADPNVIQTSSIEITNAELKTLDTDYIPVVAAPGDGKYIRIVDFFFTKTGTNQPHQAIQSYIAAIGVGAIPTLDELEAGSVSASVSGTTVPAWVAGRRYIYIGVSVDQADIQALVFPPPLAVDHNDLFSTDFEPVPGMTFVLASGVTYKVWRSITDEDTSYSGIVPTIITDAFMPTYITVGQFAQLAVLFPFVDDRPLASRPNTYSNLVSYHLNTMFALPDDTTQGRGIGAQDYLENFPILVGITFNSHTADLPTRYTADVFDALLAGVDDVAISFVLRYQVVDLTALQGAQDDGVPDDGGVGGGRYRTGLQRKGTIKAAGIFTEDDFTRPIASTSTSTALDIARSAGQHARHVGVWLADTTSHISELHPSGVADNFIDQFVGPTLLVVEGTVGRYWASAEPIADEYLGRSWLVRASMA